MKYNVTYFYRGNKGYRKVSYDCPHMEEVNQLITEISRLAIKRDYVDVKKNGELIIHKVF